MNEKEIVQNAFAPYIIKGVHTIQSVEYGYALVVTPEEIASTPDKVSNYYEVLYREIENTGGSIGAQLSILTLVLFNIPMRIDDQLQCQAKLVDVFVMNGIKGTVVLGDDKGIAGIFGHDNRKEYTAVGPNLSRDILSLGELEKDKIYVRQALYHLVKSRYKANADRIVEIKS